MARKASLQKIVAEDFYELAFVSDAQISPDGRTVAYVAQQPSPDRKGYQSAIWLSDARDEWGRRFTVGDARDHSPRWSPDGAKLAFVSDRKGSNQLWLISRDGGEAEPLTHLPNGAHSPVWSPDGDKIAFLSRANDAERAAEDKEGITNQPLTPRELREFDERRRKEEEEKLDPRVIERTTYRSGTEYFDDRQSHLYVIDVDTRQVVRLSREGFDVANPAWSPDGKHVYCGARRAGCDFDDLTSDLVRIPARGGRGKRLTRSRSFGLVPLPSPDGKWVAYLDTPAFHTSAQNAQLKVISTSGKGKRRLAGELDADFLQVAWRRDGQALWFTCGQRGNVGLYAVTLKGGRVRQVLGGNRMLRAFSVAAKADRLAFVASTPESPCDVFACAANGSRERRLTQVNAGFLKTHHVQPIEEMWYKSNDGTDVQGWVIKPPGFRRDRKHPLAVEIHGGPHVMWSPSETTMWHEWQLLASAGYVVFFCNPRGSDGYGFDFKDAIHKDWGTYPTQDILSGVDRLIDRGYIDSKKICVTGGSYGGYMTAWLVGHDDRFAAAVSQRGVYDLLSFYGTTDVPRLIEWEFDAQPWEDPVRLWEASPLAHVERVNTPLLILHSERDFRAPISSAEGMYMALRKLGRKVQFVRFPDEGHELSRSGRPKRIVKRLDHILDWFDVHVKRR